MQKVIREKAISLLTSGTVDRVLGWTEGEFFYDQTPEVFTSAEEDTLRQILAQDPRPSYQDDPTRVYGMAFAGHTVRFRVEGDTLTVCEIE